MVSRLLLQDRRIVQALVVVVEGEENRERRSTVLCRHALVVKVVWKTGCGSLREERRRPLVSSGFSAAQRKCSTNVVSVESSDGLLRLSSVIVSTEYITVEWCFANSLPISG